MFPHVTFSTTEVGATHLGFPGLASLSPIRTQYLGAVGFPPTMAASGTPSHPKRGAVLEILGKFGSNRDESWALPASWYLVCWPRWNGICIVGICGEPVNGEEVGRSRRSLTPPKRKARPFRRDPRNCWCPDRSQLEAKNLMIKGLQRILGVDTWWDHMRSGMVHDHFRWMPSVEQNSLQIQRHGALLCTVQIFGSHN